MKRILVTGATGFLGAYVLKEFIDNYEIIAIGRNEKKLLQIKNKYNDKNISVMKVDLSDIDDVLKLPNVDIVIHCAALSTVWGNKKEFINDNVLATKNIVKYSKEKGVNKIVHISTPSIYTEKKDRFNIKETEILEHNKLNYYIETKIMAEKIILDAKNDTLEVVIIRPKGLIGIGDTSILPRIIESNKKIGIPIFKDKEDILLDMTSVENVAYSILLCAEKSNISGEIFNITNGEPMHKKQLLSYVSKNLGINFKYKLLSFNKIYFVALILEIIYKLFKINKEPLLTKYTVCTLSFSQTLNIEKAVNILGYRPRISLEDEIKRFGQYYKNNKNELEVL